MLRCLCGCCLSKENERQPLLQPRPPQPNGAESARKTRAATSEPQATKQTGRLVMRRVCVPDLDLRFSDLAETFNELQGRYESMIGHIGNLQKNCGCTLNDVNISHCVGKICEEHRDKYTVSLTMKGYDFYLSAASRGGNNELSVCRAVRLAQEEVKCLSENTKAAISKGTTLQELIGWLLRSKVQMAEQVKKVAGTYQERGRLIENLEENMKEVSRAKELLLKYRHDAGEVLSQAAHIAGAPL
ncbi:uncharacterized protein [Nerophis lumbriciformis]|uniref:uncharacterized protein n=1 Tax=Nerophis lumbriciformis TaxID=546530 RepID=UPI002AE0972D|nr:uncharacterized protein si:ch73-345f18.3 [Nerophis lumbriciformis]XP_061839237.1 uncharacterized protein si:ch73-345f18.3 [Nerophis lumbriciformis]XP_061839238.1 uncharacterized protein si:ch73-345f18.3 [Nerophis lumbriciformis]